MMTGKDRNKKASWPTQNMALYSLYLPITENSGAPISPSKLQWVKDEIALFVGGCTLLPPGEGLWIAGDGQVYRDRVIQVLVVVPNDSETATFFARLASNLAQVLGQREIFIHRTNVSLVERLPLSLPTERTIPGRKALFANTNQSAQAHEERR